MLSEIYLRNSWLEMKTDGLIDTGEAK